MSKSTLCDIESLTIINRAVSMKFALIWEFEETWWSVEVTKDVVCCSLLFRLSSVAFHYCKVCVVVVVSFFLSQ